MPRQESVRRGRWVYITTNCVDCHLPGEVRSDRWRLVQRQWRCRRCAAILNHRMNPGIRRASSAAARRHGEAQNRSSQGHWLYGRWMRMKCRCKSSITYLEKGIQVCEEWMNNYEAFKNWAIANGAHENLELDRINNYGNYEPSNCRWATHAENCRNRAPGKRE
jgi:hypothetical protein